MVQRPLLRGVVETITLIGVISLVDSFEGFNADEYWKRFKTSILPINGQVSSINVEYKANLRIIENNFMVLVDKILKSDQVTSNEKPGPRIDDIHEFLDRILNDRLNEDDDQEDAIIRSLGSSSFINTSDFKENYRTLFDIVNDFTTYKTNHPNRIDITTSKQSIINDLFDLAVERQHMQQKLTDKVEENLKLVEKEIEANFQERKLPHEAFRDETAMAIGKVGIFGVVHLAFNKFWVMETLPAAKKSLRRMAAMQLISIPLCLMACVAYVKLGNILEKNSTERKKQTALEKKKESEEALHEPDTDLTSPPAQSEALHLLSTQNVYNINQDHSLMANTDAASMFDVYLDKPVVWPCGTLYDGFTRERLQLLWLVKPLGDEVLFRGILLKGLLSYMNPIAAHALTAVSYMLAQDTEFDVAAVHLGLSFGDSVILNIASSLVSQALFVVSGGISAGVLFQYLSTVYFLLREFSAMPLDRYPLREDQRLTEIFQSAAAVVLTSKYNAYLMKLKNLRAQSAVNASMKRVDHPLFQALDAQYQTLPEVKQLALGVMSVFSTDHFAGIHTFHLKKLFILFNCHLPGDKSAQKLLPEDCMDFLAAFDSAVDEEQARSSAAIPPQLVTRLNESFPDRYFGRVNKGVLRMMFCNVWPGDGQSPTAAAPDSEVTCHLLDQLDSRIRRLVVDRICAQNGGLTLAQLEDLIAFMLAKTQQSTVRLSPALLPLTPSAAESLLRSVSKWDESSSEQFMDLMQAYYSASLTAEDVHMSVLKPPIDVRMEQWLAGRRPSAIEFMNKIGEMQSRMETLKERWTTGYLKQQGGFDVVCVYLVCIMDLFVDATGLTSRRFTMLFEQKSVHDNDVKEFKDEWSAYFKGPLYMKRRIERMNNNSRGEEVRVYDEHQIAQQFRKQNEQAAAGKGWGWW
jgi:hypothetical protein